MLMSKTIKTWDKTWVENSLLESPAWITLKGRATQVFLLFLKRRKMTKVKRDGKNQWVCANGNELTFTYAEADKLGISRDGFRRAIDALVDHGLLDIVEYGGGLDPLKTVYAISERWRNYGESTFDEKKREKSNKGFCKARFCQ
jgi:hypothetical protein